MFPAIVFAPGDLHKLEYSILRHLRQEPILCWAHRHLDMLLQASDIYYVTYGVTIESSAHEELVLESWALPGEHRRWSIPLDNWRPSKNADPESYAWMMARLPIGTQNLPAVRVLRIPPFPEKNGG